MIRREFLRWTCALQLLAGRLLGQDAKQESALVTPSALAQRSFDAMKLGDAEGVASLVHPAELERFKAFVLRALTYEKPDPEIAQLQKWLEEYGEAQRAQRASGETLLAEFLKNALLGIPNFKELMSEAELQILGEIAEAPDRVHVITRALSVRPTPVSCQKHDGSWRLALGAEAMSLITNFELKEHFRKRGVNLEEVGRLMSAVKIDKIEALGHVSDGADTAQVLCRGATLVDDYRLPIFACYPVRRGEPAWEVLEDTTRLAEALTTKWTKSQ